MGCEICKGDMKLYFDQKNSEFDKKYPPDYCKEILYHMDHWNEAGKEIDEKHTHYSEMFPINAGISYRFFKTLYPCYWCNAAIKYFGLHSMKDGRKVENFENYYTSGYVFWIHYHGFNKPKFKMKHNLGKFVQSKRQLVEWDNYYGYPVKYNLIDKKYFFENIEIIKEDISELYSMFYENKYSLIESKIKEDKKQEILEEEETKKTIEYIRHLKDSIIKLLKDNPIKMPVSDIDAFLKHQNVEEIKEYCEELYNDGEISFAGNGRYFVLTEGQEKPKKTSAPKSKEVDVEKELEKYKGLLDKGLITQEEYDAKRKQILGL